MYATTHKMPPIGSRIIFSMAFGPKHVRMTSATVYNKHIPDRVSHLFIL